MSSVLGDTMQWNLRQIGDTRDVVVPVPDDSPLMFRPVSRRIRRDSTAACKPLAHGLQEGAPPAQVERSLQRIEGVATQDASAMANTFNRLRELYDTGRNGYGIRAAQFDAPLVACPARTAGRRSAW